MAADLHAKANEIEKSWEPRLLPGGQGVYDPSTNRITPVEGAGLFTKDEARFVAERQRAGDPTAQQNLGRGGQGAQNLKRVIAAHQEICRENGESDAACAGRIAQARIQYSGNVAAARAVSTMEVRMGAAAFEAIGAIGLARDAIDNVPRTSWKAINRLIVAGKEQTLDPAQKDLQVRTQQVKTAYAATMGRGSSVNTVYAQQRANDLLDTADNAAAYKQGLDTMMSEMQLAVEAPNQMRKYFADRYGPKSLDPEGSGERAPGPFAPRGGAAPGGGGAPAAGAAKPDPLGLR